MGEERNLILDEKKLEEIKKEMIQSIQTYIDLKLKPVMNYFKKKKDFFEMDFL